MAVLAMHTVLQHAEWKLFGPRNVGAQVKKCPCTFGISCVGIGAKVGESLRLAKPCLGKGRILSPMFKVTAQRWKPCTVATRTSCW